MTAGQAEQEPARFRPPPQPAIKEEITGCFARLLLQKGAENPRCFSERQSGGYSGSGLRSNREQYRHGYYQSNRDDPPVNNRSNRDSSAFSTYPGDFRPGRDQTPRRLGGVAAAAASITNSDLRPGAALQADRTPVRQDAC
jgi:hypothetical protein